MLYMTCPTCGFTLGLITTEWETKSAEICNNPKLSTEEKENRKQKLLLSLGLRRYCCKMRILTYKDIVQDIIPLQKDSIEK